MAMTTEQVYAVVDAIQDAALGKNQSIQVTDSTKFAAVANRLLSIGYDRLTGAIDQVLTKTIFTERPYSAKFRGIYMDATRWGNRIRKLNVIDPTFSAGASWDPVNDRFLNDGESDDMYKVKKAQIIMTNFLGNVTYKLQEYTNFRNVLDVAFSSEAELAEFWAMLVRNAMNVIEQAHENLSRALVATFIAQKYTVDSGNVYHLLTEYNTALGLPRGNVGDADYVPAYTATTILDVYSDYIKWCYSRINSLADLMTERTVKFHFNFTAGKIARHTSQDNRKVYFNSQFMQDVKNIVKTDTKNEGLLNIPDLESVSFWQDINAPQSLKVRISPVKADGTFDTDTTVTLDKVLGVIFDKDALGVSTCDTERSTTPYNSSGRYTNTFNHFTERYLLDLTENGIVFVND